MHVVSITTMLHSHPGMHAAEMRRPTKSSIRAGKPRYRRQSDAGLMPSTSSSARGSVQHAQETRDCRLLPAGTGARAPGHRSTAQRGVAGRYHRMRKSDKILLAPTGHLISAEGWDCAIRIYGCRPDKARRENHGCKIEHIQQSTKIQHPQVTLFQHSALPGR